MLKHNLKTILALFICSATAFVAAADEPAAKAKVLLIGKQPDHAYGSHMYLHTCQVLGECLKLNGLDSIVSDGWPKDPELLKGVKTVVVYTSPAAELLLDGPQRTEVERTLNSGVGLVTVHWASSVLQKNLDRLGEPWAALTGGFWVSNVGLGGGKSELKQLVPNHPTCRGWSNYEINDEYYLNPTVTDKATPLLQVNTGGKDLIVGWVYERANDGRSWATTLGHPYSNFEREPFRRAIVNAILWTAHVEVPEAGARVDVSAEVLQIPPKPEKK
jgi:type 1 glutamine amidotransferase